jgi:aminopeptidase YwaD
MICIGPRRKWLKRRKQRQQAAAAMCCMLVGIAPFVRPRSPVEGGLPRRGGEEVARAETGERAMRHVRYLAEEIGPRPAGGEAEKRAARYIARIMAAQGYEVEVQEGVPVPRTRRTTANVIARRGGEDSGEAIVLGAHYDSMVGREASPGANDNGSGVAVLLEVARELKEVRLEREVRFVFFGAEEVGYVGARGYVGDAERTAPAQEKARIVAMVEVDMVGVGERLWLRYAGGANEVGEGVREAARVIGVRLEEQEGDGHSDHEAFARAGIPAVWIERLPDGANHTRLDRAERVGGEKLQEVVDLVATWVVERQVIGDR